MSRKKGFTLIEVAIFLVITGALFAAVTIGVQNSIYQQRYNDSVQSFVDFLRNIYSQVTNVENNESAGRSDQAIYGKLITFGETTDPSGNPIQGKENSNVIYVYTVIGDINDNVTGGDTLSMLAALHTDVIVKEKDEESGNEEFKPAGLIESYTPRWMAQIENIYPEYTPFIGALLVVRHPKSGTVYTYVKQGETIQVNEALDNQSENSVVLTPYLKEDENDGFQRKQVDFCVNPEGDVETSNRRDVRINRNARNASGVNIFTNDNNPCNNKEGDDGS